MKRKPLNFELINQTALTYSTPILKRWLPDGYLRGAEYVARNPKRNDRKAGSFSINVSNGLWKDFATNDSGKGFISLASYLFDKNSYLAANELANMLGIEDVRYV